MAFVALALGRRRCLALAVVFVHAAVVPVVLAVLAVVGLGVGTAGLVGIAMTARIPAWGCRRAVAGAGGNRERHDGECRQDGEDE
jgi:hypothetical protein